MNGVVKFLGHGTQAASFILGGLVLVVWLVATIWSTDVSQIAHWTFDVLGVGFVVLMAGLVFLATFSLVRLWAADASASQASFWLEVGVQAASGVATLALTFTLLGISLGIGGLAGQALTPETVQPIIRNLTANFSLAFMTTVIGLPTAAFLRSVLLITNEKRQSARVPSARSQP